jgi:hypothetical protein
MPLEIQNWPLKQRVYATLAYFDVFDLALNFAEIENYLLGKIEPEELIKKNLEDLQNSKKIGFRNGLYFLSGREKLESLRKEKTRIGIEFRNWAESKSWMFKFVPFLKEVYLCNNLAFDGVTEKSDIDLFVVTSKDRIFIARTALTVLAHLLKVRRHGKVISKRFCLSFYVTEDNLDMSGLLLPGLDIYFAYWMIGLLPLWGDARKVVNENGWLKSYFEKPEQRVTQKEADLHKSWIGRMKEGILAGRFGNWWENLLKKVFVRRYEKNKQFLGEKSSVIVAGNILKYHNLDRRKEFRLAFEERLKRFGLAG